MIYYFTGQPGSGKTTLGKLLIENHKEPIIHIDGDDIRELFQNTDYSISGRRKNIQLVQDIAYFLNKTGYDVVLTLVSPFKDMRDELKNKTNVREIYIYTKDIRGREIYMVPYYEPPTENYINIDTTNLTPLESYEKLEIALT